MRNPERTGIPSQEGVTNAHITNILTILQSLNPFLLHADAYREPGSTPVDHVKLEGEAFNAASATFIKCCTRLDEIIEDAKRWDITTHHSLYKSMEDVNNAQKNFLDAQTGAAKMITRPAFQLKPLFTTVGGIYVAYWGNPNELKECIVGKGVTPEQALLDFDAAFQRTSDEQVFSIAKDLGHVFDDAPQAESPKPKRKKK